MNPETFFKGYSPSNPLIILELANNHNGSVEHGKRIIDDAIELAASTKFDIAVKFQYRDLVKFIHPDFYSRRDIKYVDRFRSTQLTWDQLLELKSYASQGGLLTACTPFDSSSVEKIIEHEFDILKIASVSCTDWPLLESLDKWQGPIVISTAGVILNDLDRVVTFLRNRKKDFALMHCVADYPTDENNLRISRIRALGVRYKEVPVGYSTHEAPENLMAGTLALASGAAILEKHMGSRASGQVVNAYSAEITQLRTWISELARAAAMLGSSDLSKTSESEFTALRDLRRYVFANKDVVEGELLSVKDVFFAIPGSESQFSANDFGKYAKVKATSNIRKGEPLTTRNATLDEYETSIFRIREQVLNFVQKSGVVVPSKAELEISHHYGIENFDRYGSCMITVVNRDYCKKLIFVLPGQIHPEMFHKKKDETFFVLFGSTEVTLDGVVHALKEGDALSIPPRVVHGFTSDTGAIIEEVSSTHFGADSFYLDDEINSNPARKTIVQYWL